MSQDAVGVGKPRAVARVSHISEDGQTTFLEFRDGRTATADYGKPFAEVGEILLVDPEDGSTEAAPRDLLTQRIDRPREPLTSVRGFGLSTGGPHGHAQSFAKPALTCCEAHQDHYVVIT